MDNITNINPTDLLTQIYNENDIKLINPITLNQKFGSIGDYIESHIFDENDVLLDSNLNYKNYSFALNSSITSGIESNIIYVEPEKDVISRGYDKGGVKILYNFLRSKIVKGELFIKEISPSRTELRLSSNTISNEELDSSITTFNSEYDASLYYKDFLLNFGSNNLIIGVKVLLDKTTPQYSVLVKLYEPLPGFLNIKDTLSLVEQISTPVSYKITSKSEDVINNVSYLKSPNFDINIVDHTNSSTEYLNYDSLFTTTTSSSYQQLVSLLDDKNIDINIDYTSFDNFIHFSSAKERLLNFQYKLQLIEQYNSQINIINSITGSTSQSFAVSESVSSFSNKINNIIQKFDGYDYYLYYESSSQAWPKTNNTYPYTLYGANSTTGLSWLGNDLEGSQYYGGQILSASQYDNLNKDYILNTVPEYLRVDEQNAPYEAFLNMIGQYFDNIWIYIKSITDLYKAENSLNLGISKDLVAYALTSLGAKLYNNGFEDGLFNNLISNQFSASVVSASIISASTSIPYNDINKEVYKRLYHNLPLLYKAKGTERGLRALISCYGIPDTILNIDEFGQDTRPLTQNYNRFSKAIDLYSGSYISAPWGFSQFQAIKTSDNQVTNDAVEFRWKNNEPLDKSLKIVPLLVVGQVYSTTGSGIGVMIDYDFNTATGSYKNYAKTSIIVSSGSNLTSSNITTSSIVYLPVMDGNWWSFLLQRETGSLNISVSGSNTYKLYIKNNLENNINFSGSVNYFTTSSFENSLWNNTGVVVVGNILVGSNPLTNVSASYQELRYWSEPLSESAFNYHVLNPYSYEGNNYSSSLNNLSYRLPLGNDLRDTSSSSHPAQSTSSFTTTLIASFNGFPAEKYSSVVETQYMNSNTTGVGVMNDKISLISASLINSESLSPYVSIEKPEHIINSNVLEVVFSPQNEIDRDIIAQLGNFNLADYLGDPQVQYALKYDDLNSLRDWYFSKYLKNYQLFDYIRLIKFFDNSLFKMIKDYVPAKAELSTGILIKPHILDRPKYQYSPITTTDTSYTASVEIGKYDSDSGGIYDNFNLEYSQSISSPLGLVTDNKTDNKEKYTGELNGSELIVSNQSLNNNPFLDNAPVLGYVYRVCETLSNYDTYTPSSGEIILYVPNTVAFGSRIGIIVKFKIHSIPTNAGDSSLKDTLNHWLNNTSQNKLYINKTNPFWIFNSFTFNNGYTTITDPTYLELYVDLGQKLTSEVYEFTVKSNVFVQSTTTSLLAYPPTSFGTVGTGINTIVEPYLPNIPFYNSGYDVDNNNALINRKSSHFVNIDSITTQLTPTNFQSIISGTAKPTQTPDSNYSSLSHIKPRYKGSISTDANVYCNYFATYDSIETSSPELLNGGKVRINKLIDSTGAILYLDGRNTNLYVVENTFKKGNQVYIHPILSSGSLLDNISSSIFWGGARFDTVLSCNQTSFFIRASSTGSTGGNIDQSFEISSPYFLTQSNSDVIVDSYVINKLGSWMYLFTNAPVSKTLYKPTNVTYNSDLLPVKNGDYFRIMSSSTETMDNFNFSYTADGIMISSSVGYGDLGGFGSGSFQIVQNTISGSKIPTNDKQAFRIYRKIISENYITINNYPSGSITTSGLLIPSNYNPNLNYLDLAKKAGLL